MIIIIYVYVTNLNIKIKYNCIASKKDIKSYLLTFKISESVYNKVQIPSEFIKILFISELSKNNVKISF